MPSRRHFRAAGLGALTAVSVLFYAACSEETVTSSAPGAEPTASLATAVTPATLIAAGDIAGCHTSYRDEATAALVAGISGTVAVLGDIAYPEGTKADFTCYDASWGRFKARTRPVPGNHEYLTNEAAPYYGYFGTRAGTNGKGYYVYTLGGWRIYALNSERRLAEQAAWLDADLAAHPAKCVLAYWHKPLFSSSSHHATTTAMRPIYRVLWDHRAEVVLNSHNHHYERFERQRANGMKDLKRGIREFVVGSGGAHRLYDFAAPAANSAKRFKGYGVLKLVLYPDRYTWKFVPVPGQQSFSDTGTTYCH